MSLVGFGEGAKRRRKEALEGDVEHKHMVLDRSQQNAVADTVPQYVHMHADDAQSVRSSREGHVSSSSSSKSKWLARQITVIWGITFT